MLFVRAAAVVMSAIVLQASLFTEMQFFGHRADILLLLAIAAAITGGPDRGAVIGFASGLGMDLLTQSPFGLAALSYCLTGYVVGSTQTYVLRSAWWLSVVTAVAASSFGVMTYVLVGEVVGQQLLATPDLWQIVAAVVVVNAVLILPATRVFRWVWSASTSLRAVAT